MKIGGCSETYRHFLSLLGDAAAAEALHEFLLKLALQMARNDYETRPERQRQGVEIAKAGGKFAGRAPDVDTHRSIVALRSAKQTIQQTAKLTGASESQVKRI